MMPASLAAAHSKAEHHLRLALMALTLALSLVLGACSGAADSGTGSRNSGAPANPLFYEIARDDGTARGWLLGTIHALPDGTAWRTPAIGAAVAEADSLIVEVAGLNDGAASAQVFRELAITPGLPPLAERVPPEHRAQAARLADQASLPPAQQQRTESWAAALILARLNASGDPANGVDRALLNDFAGRPVRELEGVRGQLGLFDRLPEAEQRSLLTAVITASTQGTSEAEALRAAWLTGDLAALEAAASRGMMADPALREALLTSRNRRWLPMIEAELQASARPLIAVGAAHLVGPEGLVAMLEARGWRLTRVT
jgi:uncharacterized protein YbaP (TraB family)